MSEVQKVNPGGPHQGPQKKEGPETEKFKEMMKQDKVSESDTEQKQKRKHREHAKAEKTAEETQRAEKKEKKKEPITEMAFPSVAGTPSATGVSKPSGEEVSITPKETVEKKKEGAISPPQSAPVEGEVKKLEEPSGKPAENIGTATTKETKETQKIPVTKETFEPVKAAPRQTVTEAGKIEPPLAQEAPAARGPLLPLPNQSPVPYMQLSPAILELFERMVGAMVIMNTSGIKETVIHLNMPQMANSVFYGSEIIIREYSSAPKEFNIQLMGTAQATEQFQSKINALYNAFHTGNFDFKVHRIETGIRPESIKRKESPADKRDSKEEQ